jgi:hypothetical protein
MAIIFPSSPTVNQTYTATHINIHGTVVAGDTDYIRFTVGASPIKALYLSKYVSVDQKGWFAIQAGSAWTIPRTSITPEMLAYGHFGPGTPGLQVGDNVLKPTNTTLTANTTYTMWIQQTGSNLTEYAFSTDQTFTGAVLPSDYSDNPLTPTTITYTASGDTWKWTGSVWDVVPNASPTFTAVNAGVVSAATVSATTVSATNVIASNFTISSINANVTGNTTGTHTGPVIGTLNGSVVSSDGSTTVLQHGSNGSNAVFTGSVTGNVTGTVSSISNHALTGLSNIDPTAPTNGQFLVYNNTASKWAPTTVVTGFNGGNVTNPINLNNTAISTTTSSGALQVTGGVGIAGNLNIGGYLTIGAGNELRFFNTAGTFYTALKSANVSANKTYTLPSTDGTSGQFLQTNGLGSLTWASSSGAGGGTPPGGANTYVQFNNLNSFGGDSSFAFNVSTTTLTVPTLNATGIANFTNSTISSSAGTGAVQVTGGVGIQGQLNVNGAINKITSSTASTSTSTGALIIAGGIGIAQNAYVGGNVNLGTAPTAATHAASKAYVDSNILAFSMAFGV